MLAIQDYPIFLGYVIFASIIPGPSMLLGATHGHQFGVSKSITTALGHILMTAIQSSLSLVGVGIFLQNAPHLLQALQVIGIIYLLYVGGKLFVNTGTRLELQAEDEKSGWPRFVEGVAVTASNPKAILFFGAIFPQFLNIEKPIFLQTTLMVATAVSVTFCCFMLYAFIGDTVISKVAKRYTPTIINRFFGSTFIVLALLLLFRI